MRTSGYPVMSFTGGLNQPSGLSVDHGILYVGLYSANEIQATDLRQSDTPDFTPVLSLGSPFSITVKDSTIYGADYLNGGIYSYNLKDQDPHTDTIVPESDSLQEPNAFAWLDNELYIGERSGERVTRWNGPVITAIAPSLNDSFTIYPNPASDVLYLEGLSSEQHSVSIVDIQGKILYS